MSMSGSRGALFPQLLNSFARVRGQRPDFWSTAAETWALTPNEQRTFPPATFLPGQLDRIEETVFGDMEATFHALGTCTSHIVGSTIAARFRDVLLYDGVLYKGSAAFHLARRKRHFPALRRPPRISSAALYDSWIGLRYFGNWLMDDCETYRLAETIAPPVTIRLETSGHRKDYEDRLSIAPLRTQFAHFDELVLFQDLANNTGKIARAADRRKRLLAGMVAPEAHSGVFLMRGRTGDPRVLMNEERLAERLAARHGIRILHPEEHSVESLVSACAGARVLIGVEGSQLTHALTVMPPGGTMLALFPPDRVTAAMKLMTDRLGLNFALVIGKGTAGGFEIDPAEVESTLDLLP
ncbi:glycosyltransferase 61 family protein [Devosia submarina]|uniref:glycosyltransferase 61 family protein n=1 Tax=Devosia submarina TaxID=1173082 RepID=UPI001300A5AE|nr:glycosyltransferase family 61 protein [Devosia submarina]